MPTPAPTRADLIKRGCRNISEAFQCAAGDVKTRRPCEVGQQNIVMSGCIGPWNLEGQYLLPYKANSAHVTAYEDFFLIMTSRVTVDFVRYFATVAQ